MNKKMDSKKWFLVVGNFDYCCFQNRENPKQFAIWDRNRQMYTLTDDCIMEVAANPNAYKWVCP